MIARQSQKTVGQRCLDRVIWFLTTSRPKTPTPVPPLPPRPPLKHKPGNRVALFRGKCGHAHGVHLSFVLDPNTTAVMSVGSDLGGGYMLSLFLSVSGFPMAILSLWITHKGGGVNPNHLADIKLSRPTYMPHTNPPLWAYCVPQPKGLDFTAL